ncbi:cation-translocating P-type ATPase [Candidatus Chloroploca sp. Khr17]|uniref:cation-translocating P-type ATPase n=1 Tax=Candidatus Chloroploca sp. Khr17 TaxID=2496869 RepID=UPI00101C8DD5|nr:cation-translocating P-type ATPase [Candidatus Chloroploca sp. Khr17]
MNVAPPSSPEQHNPSTGTLSATPQAESWYALPPEVALQRLTSASTGLDQGEAQVRLAQYGANELIERGGKHPAKILWEQFTNVMVLILIAAAVLSLFLGKFLEAGAILAIVVLFAVLGFFQEYRAEKAIAALKKLAVPSVRAYRNGKLLELPARELVPGDVIALEAGNLVPADVRIIESINLRIQESALTGESEPVEKVAGALNRAEVPLADRRNMAYLGTTATYGRGSALVVATGMQTELGTIADLLQAVPNEATPLQVRLDMVGKQLAVAGVIVAVLIFGIGLWMGEQVTIMLLTAVSLAVAVIPEGLPAVVTFTLALGAQRMLKRNALIRKLPAVETLGSVTTICSDKTGTLTENRMTVTMVVLPGMLVELNNGHHGSVAILKPDAAMQELRTQKPVGSALLLAGAALCNDATLSLDPATGQYELVGDPTESSLLVAAAHGQLLKHDLEHAMPRVAELPFDSDRKRMTTVHRRPHKISDAHLAAIWGRDGYASEMAHVAVTKGAADGLLDVTSQVWTEDGPEPLTETWRQAILTDNERLARNGIRVLGVAFRPLASTEGLDEVERDLIFLGLLGMIDPPRAEVRAAVATCREAGIRPVMITGDHPLTASYIARTLGIATDEAVVTGSELSAMSDEQLVQATASTAVFARVSPEHKLRIVASLQRQGHVVAMTGDGVNDAPALKKADIGVAMGITGTDVSKEASAMVLRDDNFATIVAAVEEGRVIYDNLRRFVKFAVAGNIGKVLVMLLWPLLFFVVGMPTQAAVALLPLQLLWLNLMTDGLLGLSMGMEPAERHVMHRPPHSSTEGIFAGGMGWQVTWVGIVIGALALGVGFWYYQAGLAQWQTMIVVSLTLLQVFQALATRSNTESILTIGVFSNRVMWGIIVLVVGLQVLALFSPLGLFLGLLPLTLNDMLICVGLGILLFVLIEVEKLIQRRRS